MTVETSQRVRQFIVENFYISNPAEITDDTLLVSNGYIDSTGMLEVISFLESEFGIQISDQETTPENLESVKRITDFVSRKQGRSAA
jgi:acyl carrier protein